MHKVYAQEVPTSDKDTFLEHSIVHHLRFPMVANTSLTTTGVDRNWQA